MTLLPARSADLGDDDRATLAEAGVEVVEAPVQRFDFDGRVAVHLADGTAREFDTLYPALGTHAN